jgi:outer membrane receptor protein involved in Fe transport
MVAAGAIDGTIQRVSWRWNVSGVTRKRDDPGALPKSVLMETPYASDPLYRFDAVDRTDVSSSLVLRDGVSDWKPQVRVYTTFRGEDLVRTIQLVPRIGDRRARELSTNVLGGSLEGERIVGSERSVMTRFGGELSREQLDTTYRSVELDGTVGEVNSEASGHRGRAGLFASAAWQAVPRVRLIGGIRWDNIDDVGFGTVATSEGGSQRAWSPRAGVVVRIAESEAIRLFGQVSRAFKAPTLDQLFDPRPYPDFRGGTFTISNPNLVPQRASNMEIGIAGGTRVRWSALAFNMLVDDEIDFDVRTFSYANIGESRHTGLELGVGGHWWRRLEPSIEYSMARVVADGTEQLKNVPRHLLTLGSGANLPWAVGLFARYQRSWGGFLDDENLFALDGRSTFDIRLRRSFRRNLVFADFLNVTANKYEEYGFTLTDFTGSSVPYAYSGAPRAVRAGMTVVF